METLKNVWRSVCAVLGLRRIPLGRKTLADDGKAGLVLGIESVPDGLASGLLAGVNPVAGLYAYMFGVTSAAFFTSTSFMAVQGTSAMAIIVADVDAVHSGDDPERVLWTLTIMTGLVMIVAGILKLGSILRFVSNSVMVGFITALGINIILGQLDDFTGYESEGANRVARAFDLLVNFWEVHLPTLIVGAVTVALIIVLRKTPLGALGMVVAIVVGSVLAAILIRADLDIAVVGDIAEIPRGLPAPAMPRFGEMFSLLIPAFSLAFVGLVQGAGISGALPNPDGSESDANADFRAQGAGNVVTGVFQGMPVGGSMSASSLVSSGGAKSRTALVMAGGVMAMVVLLFAGVVEYIAMPALAGLLIVVGFETIKPANVVDVFHTGRVQATVMIVTLVLTLIIPLQYAVLVGVGISMILYIARQSNQLSAKRLVLEDGRFRTTEPPDVVPAHEVIIIQPFGSLFFASAPMFDEKLPTVEPTSTGSVVILRLRGKDDLGSTIIEVLKSYATSLTDAGSKLVVITDSDTVVDQLAATGATGLIGSENIVRGTQWLTEALSDTADDADVWVNDHRSTGGTPGQD